MPTAGSGERRPGRPRSAQAERAILAAALEELATNGVDGFRMESVAARAGVAKTTVYRRWAGRDQLVLDVLAGLPPDSAPPATGAPIREQLVAALDQLRDRHTTSVHERLLPRVMAAARSHPELWDAYRQHVVERRRDWFRAILRGGVESGELRPDLDVELVWRALVYPMLFTLMGHAAISPVPEDFAERLVDVILDGISAR